MERYGSLQSSAPRRHVYAPFTLTPVGSIMLPAWAVGGRAMLYLTGTAAGASGNIGADIPTCRGGGAGAYALRHPIPIPAGTTSFSLTLGLPGAAVTSNAAASGNPAGSLVVEVGSRLVRLNGGGNGSSANAHMGGLAMPGGHAFSDGGGPGPGTAMTSASGPFGGGGTLAAGLSGVVGNTPAAGIGGVSVFGSPAPRSMYLQADVSAVAGAGYGYGGSSVWTSGGATPVTSGAGGPAFALIEIEEGF